jgi:hypothetical protein
MERGCVEDQPQRAGKAGGAAISRRAAAGRGDTAALRDF